MKEGFILAHCFTVFGQEHCGGVSMWLFPLNYHGQEATGRDQENLWLVKGTPSIQLCLTRPYLPQ